MKKIVFLLCATFAATASFAYNATLARLIKDNYASKADSLTSALISQFMNTTKGTFWTTPQHSNEDTRYIYWQQAHAIDVVIYGYQRHKEDNITLATKYRQYMTRWYNNHGNNYSGGSTSFENPFTDDMCWIGLSLMRLSEALGVATYSNTAKRLFDNAIITRGQEDERGFWLPWNNSGTGPNACTESPACLLALKLYLKTNEEKYLDYAKKLYTFMINNIAKADGRVEDPPLTYTQGTFAEACRVLYHVTGETIYKTKAQLYINYAFTSDRCTSNGLLRDEGSSMDQSLFKAVLIPYAVNYVLDESMTLVSRRNLVSYLQTNANALWKNLDKEAFPAMYCPYYWGKAYDPSKDASMGAMVSGASLLENICRMCIDLTTKPDDDAIQVPLRPVEPQHGNIYTLSGRLVRRGTDTSGLPAGIYLINNKKIAIH